MSSSEPKARSYSGCFSCRAIKKKCLEDFDAEGRCGRCVSRGVHCERNKPVRRPGGNPHGKRANGAPSTSGTAKTRNTGSSARANGGGGGGAHSTTPPSLDDLSTVALSMAGKDGHPHHYGGGASSLPPIQYDPDSMQLPIPPPIPSTSAVPYSAPMPTSLPLPLPINPWDQMFNFLESDPSANVSVDPSLPHFDWAALTANQAAELPPPPPPPPSAPGSRAATAAAMATTSRQAGLPTGMEDILNGLATGTASAPSIDSASPTVPVITPASSTTTAAPLEDDPLEQDLTDDMAVIYNALNIEFLSIMPTGDRLRAAKAWTDLARSTRLGRTAAAACVWLYLARSSRTVDPEERSHLLAQSDRYFQRAVAQLSDEVSLDSQIYALLDLFFVQADRSSIHSGNALLAIGELFIKQAHGPRPPLDLVNHNSPSSLRMFAVLDILRCAVEKGRRTVFDIEGLPGSLRAAASAKIAAKVDAEDNDWRLLQWSGFPLELILCLAATVNLDCDRAAMPPEAVNAVADKIEEAIRSWNPARMQANGYEDSLTYVQEVATKEMWRHATLLHFYRVIRQYGCLARPIQDSLYQLLHLGQFKSPPPQIKPLDPPMFEVSKLWLRAFPWFMAATVATQPAERKLCRAGLRSYWSDSIIEENIKAAECMWSQMDQTGRDGDFREILQQGGLCAAFV
ncbi:hypothetical protein JCM10908_006582 [Rhodotorula pacifica]|uniref:uncharacterized protein n=1 Tax=Rhodotorula pacifica TaxID=1495444 RepID=UPI00317A2338